jgi:hypothetical protein
VSKMTKGDRAELRSLIKQRFRVLREEVEERKAELLDQLEDEITRRFADEEKAWADAEFLISEATREANRKANDVMRGLLGDKWRNERLLVGANMPGRPRAEQYAIRSAGKQKIEVQVKQAMLALSRQEADLLTELTADAVESEAAARFLTSIPTVSQLVPTVRLLELEASLKREDRP